MREVESRPLSCMSFKKMPSDTPKLKDTMTLFAAKVKHFPEPGDEIIKLPLCCINSKKNNVIIRPTLTSFCSSKSSVQGFRLECCIFDANSDDTFVEIPGNLTQHEPTLRTE